MRNVNSAEICLRCDDGALDLADPDFQNAVYRHRLSPAEGEHLKRHLAGLSVMALVYSSLSVACLPLCIANLGTTLPPLIALILGFGALAITLTAIRAYFVSIYRVFRFDKLIPTSQIGLSADGIRLISNVMTRFEKLFFRWDDISTIKLSEADFLTNRNPNASLVCAKVWREPSIEIIDLRNRVMRVRLSAIRSIEERKILVEMLKKHARRAAGKDAIAQIVRVNQMQDLAFTQLWSNALKSKLPRNFAATLETSTLLQDGRFMIKEQIGGGGQGAVYRAEMLEDTGEIKTVALKEYVLPEQEHLFDRKRAIDQFEREVHLLTRMNHKSIISLLDAFVEDHRAYLVMELVAGQSLKDRVKLSGPLSEPEMQQLALKLCETLDYLHQQKPQIVHMDVTPENVLLRENGDLMLIDFNTSSDGSGLRTKLIAGKQKYMSPEQFRNEVSPSCDIYALGCTMFYMLTGIEPEPLTTCNLAEHRSGADPEFVKLLASATDLDGSRRLQTVAEMIKTLSAMGIINPRTEGE